MLFQIPGDRRHQVPVQGHLLGKSANIAAEVREHLVGFVNKHGFQKTFGGLHNNAAVSVVQFCGLGGSRHLKIFIPDVAGMHGNNPLVVQPDAGEIRPVQRGHHQKTELFVNTLKSHGHHRRHHGCQFVVVLNPGKFVGNTAESLVNQDIVSSAIGHDPAGNFATPSQSEFPYPVLEPLAVGINLAELKTAPHKAIPVLAHLTPGRQRCLVLNGNNNAVAVLHLRGVKPEAGFMEKFTVDRSPVNSHGNRLDFSHLVSIAERGVRPEIPFRENSLEINPDGYLKLAVKSRMLGQTADPGKKLHLRIQTALKVNLHQLGEKSDLAGKMVVIGQNPVTAQHSRHREAEALQSRKVNISKISVEIPGNHNTDNIANHGNEPGSAVLAGVSDGLSDSRSPDIAQRKILHDGIVVPHAVQRPVAESGILEKAEPDLPFRGKLHLNSGIFEGIRIGIAAHEFTDLPTGIQKAPRVTVPDHPGKHGFHAVVNKIAEGGNLRRHIPKRRNHQGKL